MKLTWAEMTALYIIKPQDLLCCEKQAFQGDIAPAMDNGFTGAAFAA